MENKNLSYIEKVKKCIKITFLFDYFFNVINFLIGIKNLIENKNDDKTIEKTISYDPNTGKEIKDVS